MYIFIFKYVYICMSFLLNPPIPFHILRKRTSQFFGSPSPPLRLCGTAPGRSRSSSSESTYSGNLIRLNPGSPEQRKLRSVFFFPWQVLTTPHLVSHLRSNLIVILVGKNGKMFQAHECKNHDQHSSVKSMCKKKIPHGPEQQGNHNRKPHG